MADRRGSVGDRRGSVGDRRGSVADRTYIQTLFNQIWQY